MGTLATALRPIARDMTDAPRIYADANVPAGVVAMMRRELRWDVLFVVEHDDLRRASDASHFSRAAEQGRVLVTLDRDFLDDRRFPPALGPGVIVCSAPDADGLCRLLRYAHRTLIRREGPGVPVAGHKVLLTPDAAV